LKAVDHGSKFVSGIDGESFLALFGDNEAQPIITETGTKDGRQRDSPLRIDAVLVCAEEFHKTSIPDSESAIRVWQCAS